MKNEPTMLTKDIHWQIAERKYVVRNVPYLKADHDREELLDMDVSIAITTLRDLMVENEIPHDVSYEDFADIEF
jgi:chromosome condensin MukBEF complex kleisin-like MukF subunit